MTFQKYRKFGKKLSRIITNDSQVYLVAILKNKSLINK
jgi:hypothetical protein